MDLISAVISGDLAIVRDLLSSGHDFRVKEDIMGRSLIHLAAQQGHKQLFSYLTGIGLDPDDVENMDGETVLHCACRRKNCDMVIFLTKQYPYMKDRVDKFGYSILHRAAFTGNVDMFKYLVKLGLDVNYVSKSGTTVLQMACMLQCNYDIVWYIIKTYPNLKDKPDNHGQTILHYAAKFGSVNFFKYLVSLGADVYRETTYRENVLMKACLSFPLASQLRLLKYMVTAYPLLLKKKDILNFSAIHHAALSGHVEIFKVLEEQRFNVFELGIGNRTVLHIACETGCYNLVKYLLSKYPAMSTKTTTEKETPLLLAAKKKQNDVVGYLIDTIPEMLEQTITRAEHVRDHSCAIRYLKEFTLQRYHSVNADQDNRRTFENVNRNQGGEYAIRWVEENEFHAWTSTSGVLSEETSNLSSTPLYQSHESLLSDKQGLVVGRAELVRTSIKTSGKSSKETKALLHWLCTCAEEHMSDVECVIPGYKITKPDEPILLAVVKQDASQAVENSFETFDLIVRTNGKLSGEAKHISQIEDQRKLIFSADERTQLRKILTKYSKQLMEAHCNLEVISASKLKSRKYGETSAEVERTTCIVLYVPVKGIIPFHEDPFPTVLDGFPVDVREGRFKTFSDPNEFHQNLMMGCQIQPAYNNVGALGAFVELTNGRVCCLTCWHLFLSEESKLDRDKPSLNREHFKRGVFQPNNTSDFYLFGNVIDYRHHPGDNASIGVDAALIEITADQRIPKDGHFPNATSNDAGFSKETPMEFASGKVVTSFEDVEKTCNVVKYGPVTGHTRGMLCLAGTAVRKTKFTYYTNPEKKEEDKYELHQQFEIAQPHDIAFSRMGDSGTLVFLMSDKGNKYEICALGILVGGTDHNTTIVTPIWAVLGTFNLPMKLLSFPSTMSNVRPQTDDTTSSIRTLESDVSVLKAQVSSLQDDMTTVKSDVAGLKLSQSNMDSKLDCLPKVDSKVDRLLEMMTSQSCSSRKPDTLTPMEEEESL